jgi:hypothetical protein
MLKFSYESKDEIPQGAEGFYKEVNGKWILDAEGIAPIERVNELNAKVTEFRNSNKKLAEDLKAFEGKKVITEEEHTEFTTLREKAEKGTLKPEEIETIVEKRTDKMRKQHTSEVTALRTQLDETTGRSKKLHGELEESRVQSAIANTLADIAVPKKGAMQDILSRGRGIWTMNEEGKLIAVDPDGNERMGGDGKPLTIKEFVNDIVKEAPYLFEDSKGGGARGAGTPAARGGVRTISASNKEGVSRDLENIAAGKTVVDLSS